MNTQATPAIPTNAEATALGTAIDTLKAALGSDPELAWAWHCNMAVPLIDAGAGNHKVANEAAAHLMQHLFDCDITTHPHYEYGKSGAQSYAEFRIAMDEQEDAAIAKATGAA